MQQGATQCYEAFKVKKQSPNVTNDQLDRRRRSTQSDINMYVFHGEGYRTAGESKKYTGFSSGDMAACDQRKASLPTWLGKWKRLAHEHARIKRTARCSLCLLSLFDHQYCHRKEIMSVHDLTTYIGMPRYPKRLFVLTGDACADMFSCLGNQIESTIHAGLILMSQTIAIVPNWLLSLLFLHWLLIELLWFASMESFNTSKVTKKTNWYCQNNRIPEILPWSGKYCTMNELRGKATGDWQIKMSLYYDSGECGGESCTNVSNVTKTTVSTKQHKKEKSTSHLRLVSSKCCALVEQKLRHKKQRNYLSGQCEPWIFGPRFSFSLVSWMRGSLSRSFIV